MIYCNVIADDKDGMDGSMDEARDKWGVINHARTIIAKMEEEEIKYAAAR